MYSGTTLTRYSGRVLGTHQKIDRIARKHLTRLLKDNTSFPTSRQILHFEGKNGPDAIKRKSPAKDEPWHYYDPYDDKDSLLINLIDDHYKQLVNQLRKNSRERAAFEAAWLAHALVDGLTPAHHYPYEEKLTELRGEGLETRTTLRQKIIIPGVTRRDSVQKNWRMWGPKGLFLTHGLFEIGIATIFAPLTFSEALPKKKDILKMETIGPLEYFKQTARMVADLDMYKNYYEKGWTPRLAWQVRHKLGPEIVKLITLVWYNAQKEAEKA